MLLVRVRDAGPSRNGTRMRPCAAAIDMNPTALAACRVTRDSAVGEHQLTTPRADCPTTPSRAAAVISSPRDLTVDQLQILQSQGCVDLRGP